MLSYFFFTWFWQEKMSLLVPIFLQIFVQFHFSFFICTVSSCILIVFLIYSSPFFVLYFAKNCSYFLQFYFTEFCVCVWSLCFLLLYTLQILSLVPRISISSFCENLLGWYFIAYKVAIPLKEKLHDLRHYNLYCVIVFFFDLFPCHKMKRKKKQNFNFCPFHPLTFW